MAKLVYLKGGTVPALEVSRDDDGTVHVIPFDWKDAVVAVKPDKAGSVDVTDVPAEK